MAKGDTDIGWENQPPSDPAEEDAIFAYYGRYCAEDKIDS